MSIKIKAALDAREDPDFVIAARTDADTHSFRRTDPSLQHAYADAGADLVMPVLMKRNEYELVAEKVDAPLWLLLGGWVDLTVADLMEMGVRGIVTHAVESTFVAAKAVMYLMDEIRNKGTVKETLDKLKSPDFKEFFPTHWS